MDVHCLQLLRELAERGSITAVARATNRTVSAVSQQLKVLEREAGLPLTERSGRGIVLTGAGRMLAQTATDIAIALERADAVWKEFTLTPDFDIADAPGLKPSWHERGLAVVKLMDEPLDIALPEGHPLANKASLSAKDLVDVTWIGVPLGFPYDRILRQLEAITGVPATIGQRIFLDNGIAEALVATGHGIAILPRFTTRDHDNGLVTRPLSGIRSTRQISALMRPDRAERPSVRLVTRALRDVASGVAAQH
jgi:DNA-binding transcriptional LysR family regulator